MNTDKPLPITKEMVWRAYQAISKNGKAAGIDGQSLDDFSKDLRAPRKIGIYWQSNDTKNAAPKAAHDAQTHA